MLWTYLSKFLFQNHIVLITFGPFGPKITLKQRPSRCYVSTTLKHTTSAFTLLEILKMYQDLTTTYLY